jgi:dTDP-4-dehydrorhamnose reductase
MKRILVLGHTGMLGLAVTKELLKIPGSLTVTQREPASQLETSDFKIVELDATDENLREKLDSIGSVDFIVNCIGVIKPHIDDTDSFKRNRAIKINTLFPYEIEKWATLKGAKVLQIATDCVFSGDKGGYLETNEHDALDVYGKSKSLGEVPSESMMHLRVSIIGPESGRSTSLLEWVRNQPIGSSISGYTDHFWNGVTTLHFAKIARGIIENNLFKAGVFHIVPRDSVSKHDLVCIIARHLNRQDIVVSPTLTGSRIDRTLLTVSPETNTMLWRAAGYHVAPTIEEMVAEII